MGARAVRLGELGRVSGLWFAVALSVLIVQAPTSATIGSERSGGFFPFRAWVVQDDSKVFAFIAEFGYRPQVSGGQLPGWFPGFPLIVRLFHLVLRDWPLATVVASAAAGLGLTLVFFAWCRAAGLDGASRWLAVLALLLYPYAIFLLGVPYSDATFVMFMISAFLAAERDRLVLAGVLCACASATRVVGLAGAPCLVLAGLERSRVVALPFPRRWFRWEGGFALDRSRFRMRHLTPLIGCAGAFAFFAYCWVHLGDPFRYFAINDEMLGRPPLFSWSTLLKTDLTLPSGFRFLLHDGHVIGIYSDLLLALAVLASVPAVVRRFGWGVGLYQLAVWISIWTASFRLLSTGRYALAAFPMFAVVGEWLAQRPTAARVAYLSVSAALLAVVANRWDLGRALSAW